MQSDTIIWEVIGKNFCSFKVRSPDDKKHFCKNEYNLTGLCNRKDCPLANSQYATVRNIKGKCVLMMKTIERSHMPSKLWEQYTLSNNAEEAKKEIEAKLLYWPKSLISKCKKRYTRLKQVLRQMRRIALQKPEEKAVLSTFTQKIARREKKREAKAEAAAKLEKSIEKELLGRLEEGVYGDMYNINPAIFNKVTENTIPDADRMLEDEEIEYEEGDFFQELGSEAEEELIESDVEDNIEEADLDFLFLRQKKAKPPVVHIEYDTEEQRDKITVTEPLTKRKS